MLDITTLKYGTLRALQEVELVDVQNDEGSGCSIYRIPDVYYFSGARACIVQNCIPEETINHKEHAEFAITALKRRAQGKPRSLVDSADEVCIVGNPCSGVFFHWIEDLLKVAALEAFGFKGKYVLPPSFPGFCYDSLLLMGVAPHRVDRPVEDRHYVAGWFTSHLNLFNIHEHPRVFQNMRALLEANTRMVTDHGDRIWIDRNPAVRGIVNAEEIDTVLRAKGFVKLDMAAFPIADQIGIARQARIIAGPHGSGIAHCAFMAPGGKVIEAFSPLYIYPSLLHVCRQLNHRYRMVVGNNAIWDRYPHGNDVYVDLLQFELAFRD